MLGFDGVRRRTGRCRTEIPGEPGIEWWDQSIDPEKDSMKRFASLVALALFSSPLLAADAGPIGYVDMQRVIEQSKLGKQAEATLKEKFSDPQAELQKEQQAIRQLQETTSRDAALMSEAELEKRKKELQERVAKLQRDAATAQQELAQEQAKLGAGIIRPAQEIIAELAKEKELSAVFERGQSGLLYIEDGLNLTDEVVKRLNARTD
jgi:outer membrane protein